MKGKERGSKVEGGNKREMGRRWEVGGGVRKGCGGGYLVETFLSCKMRERKPRRRRRRRRRRKRRRRRR